MEKRKFGKLQLTRETLKNLTTEQLDKVAGGRTENCTTDTSATYSVCWKCQDTPTCPTVAGTYCGDTCDECATGGECTVFTPCDCD